MELELIGKGFVNFVLRISEKLGESFITFGGYE